MKNGSFSLKYLRMSEKCCNFAAFLTLSKEKSRIMSTYSITLNEKTAQSQALLAYLEALQVQLTKIPKVRVRKSSFERSEEDIKKGRVQRFASADEMCNALGI